LKTPYFQNLPWVWQNLPKNGKILQMTLKFVVPLEGSSHFRQDLLYLRQILKIWCFQWGFSHMSNFHNNILL
jgi:hypothetical protein